MLVFEKSRPGRRGVAPPRCDVPEKPLEVLLPEKYLREDPPPLPELGELDVVRHFSLLAARNMCVDTSFYPLGSCTMKYNPKINEAAAAQPQFLFLHPYQPEGSVQGMLEIFYQTERFLSEISGLPYVSLQPAAGAHGELTSLMVIRAFLEDQGKKPGKILIPDSAHGTNPASCTLCGFRIVQVNSGADGTISLEDLKKKVDENTSGIMITNPNTLGLFEKNILKVSECVHEAGGLVYMDGANLNAILGVARPVDFGVDVMHFNLHKTFSTPHGGGGPGAGPISVRGELEPFLPIPRIEKGGSGYFLNFNFPKSIGKTRSFYGNAGVIVKTFAYIRSLGSDGLKRVSEFAVLNANYLLARLKEELEPHFHHPCMHEFVLSAKKLRKRGVRALDIAKRLLDYSFHPPTIYFPLIVPEALMIEPTETESKETLDAFAEALISIVKESEIHPEVVREAPHFSPVSRLDEVKANREPRLRWKGKEEGRS